DLTREVQIGADGMPTLDYDANPDCYSLEQIRSLQQDLFALLECWLTEPRQPRAVPLGELYAVRRARQRPRAPASANGRAARKVPAASRQQAQARPERVALVQEATSLSYGQLQERAERMAAALLEKGVQPGARVGVMLSRSPQAILAQLGVL